MTSFLPQLWSYNAIAQFNRINRAHEVYSIVFALGGYIKQGFPLNEAFLKAAKTATRKKDKTRLTEAGIALASGVDIKQLINTSKLAFLPKEIRIILASNLTNTSKGNLLCEWQEKSYILYQRLIPALYTVVPTLAVSILVLLAFGTFIVPQFIEITMSLDIEQTFLMKAITAMTSNVFISVCIFSILIVLLLALLWFILKKIFAIQKLIDYSNLYQCLSIIELDEFDTFLGIMANKYFFPSESSKFNKFRSALHSGTNFDEAAKIAQIDHKYIWFLKLGLNTSDSRTLFELANKMVNCKIDFATQTMVSITPTIITIALGTMIGLVAITIFQMMTQIVVTAFG